MEIRQMLHAHPLATLGVCIVMALGAIYLFPKWKEGPSTKYTYPGLYYSSDDGVTYSANKGGLITPFYKDGVEWVRACVYTHDGKTPFVAYLEKCTPEVKEELEGLQNAGLQMQRMEQLGERGLLIKRPGDAEWIQKDSTNPASLAITNVVSPETQKPATELIPQDWRTGK